MLAVAGCGILSLFSPIFVSGCDDFDEDEADESDPFRFETGEHNVGGPGTAAIQSESCRLRECHSHIQGRRFQLLAEPLLQVIIITSLRALTYSATWVKGNTI